MSQGKTEISKDAIHASIRTFHFLGESSESVLSPLSGNEYWPAALQSQSKTNPEDQPWVPLESPAFFELYSNIVGGHRKAVTKAFREKVAHLAALLGEQLTLDRVHTPEGTSPSALTASMGAGVDKYVDTDAMSRTLGAYRGSSPMEIDRRERIQRTLKTLRDYLDTPDQGPAMNVVHSGAIPSAWDLPGDVVFQEEDTPAAAMRMYEKCTKEMLPVFRAVRVAKLDVKTEYDVDRYDNVISSLDGRFLTAEELQLVRGIVVVEHSERLQGDLFPSLSRLLNSGLPIQVLVLHNALSLNHGDHAFAFRCVAHREAFVAQTTPLQTEQTARSLEGMARTVRPSLIFMAKQPSLDDQKQHWLSMAAAHFGRAVPCFRFSPCEGTTWTDWFVLDANEQPEEMWPEFSCVSADSTGQSTKKNTRCTFADAVSLDPEGQKYFSLIPDDAWGDDQVELSVYLDQWISQPPKQIPYIWMTDGNGVLHRAVLTRELAMACRARARFWRMLQELGGVRNEYVRRTEDCMRKHAEQELAEMEAAHSSEVEAVRKQTAEDTVSRIVTKLLGMESIPLFSATSVTPEESAVENRSTLDVKEAAPQESVNSDEPYIETSLCTTCEECVKLNPKMFKYNEDKQAYLADASAGTFAQLVNAAIKCAGVCIHPGKPRTDDKSASEKLIAKAAEFN